MHGGGDGNQATSVTKIFGNIFISFVGAGVLGLPYAFRESGVLEGILVMLFVAFLAVKAMLLLIDCKYRCVDMMNHDQFSMKQSLLGGERSGASTPERNNSGNERSSVEISSSSKSKSKKKKNIRKDYEDEDNFDSSQVSYGTVGKMAFGKWGAFTVDAAIVISQIGFCCAYVIFLSQNISHYLAGCYEEDDALMEPDEEEEITDQVIQMYKNITTDQQQTLQQGCEIVAKSYQSSIVLVLLLPLLLLCQVRHLNRLAIFSLLADFANVFAYLIVFWFDFEHVSKVTIHPKEMDFAGLPFFMSVSMYCYEGAGMILALEESVHPDHRSRFKSIFSYAMVAITMLYVVFGVSGYLSFGPETKAIITLNLPAGIFPGIVKACLCFSLFFTFPIMMFPVVETIERRFKIYSGDRMKGTLVRCASPVLVAIIVLVIPSFSAIMGLIGATCCSLLAFILPALFHMKLFKGTLKHNQEVMNYVLLGLGVVGAILGTHDALARIGLVHSSRPHAGH